ncbi:cell wall-associated protein [Chryseobacterium lathyri]|uniref:Cell wall-associated protein n=2 Tax=Chryseobacterium lathyri TaxID=395933 RepID=A0A511Y8S7_9FLAO|nr:cell wall-associated protein [Chryseobacterium lathyri]
MSYAQTTDTENYVQSISYLDSTKVSDPSKKKSQTVQYFDGLGRLKQTVNVKASPLGRDLVTPFIYDNIGRQAREYFPIPQNSSTGGAMYQQASGAVPYPVADPGSIYAGEKIFSEKQFENSPLDRIQQLTQPGTAWSTKPVQYAEGTNRQNDNVKKYETVTSWDATNKIYISSVSQSSFFTEGQLYKNTTTDEDGNKTVEFKNGRGQTVLSRKVLSDSENADTYYVYNEYEQLAYIIPPAAAIATPDNTVLDNLCYQYRYDSRYRLAEKKLPGKGWDLMVYDKQDRLILTQDAVLRTTINSFGARGWLFTKYDQFDRVVYTGFFSNTATRIAMQTAVNNMAANPGNNETRTETSFMLNNLVIYYTKNAFPTGSMTILTVNYYDSYPTNIQVEIPTTILGHPVLTQPGQGKSKNTSGLPLASYLKNIEDGSWTMNFNWYDTKGRVIGTNSINHLAGFTNTKTEYDFAGVVKQKVTAHKKSRYDQGEVIVKERFVYDDQNRLKQHYHQVDDKPEQLLAENTYDELSQLVNKKVGDNLQSIDYDYNIRGWLTAINKNQMGLPDLGGKLFAFKAKYNSKDGIENPDSVLFSGKNVIPRYNGNIAEIDWRSIETLGAYPSLTPKRYGYVYDKLDRLTAGYYQNPNNPNSIENTESLTYDLNGNITNLYRTSVMEYGNTTPTVIDDLVYTNVGNQAVKIKDNKANSTGYEGAAGGPIVYDANGNIKVMLDKQITNISYNHLNLPDVMNIGSDQITTQISTKYRADGVKLRKEFVKTTIGFSGTETTTQVTDYLDGFQYFKSTSSSTGGNGDPGSSESFSRAMEPQAYSLDLFDAMDSSAKIPDLQFFPTAEGFYDYTKNQYIYNYSDHLGNVRVSFARNSAGALEIVDSNDYYPFGMNHLKTGNAYFGAGSYKNYKFGKKELQETGFYDFGSRMYMNDGVRWMSPDPLSEEFSDWSPYSYALNNPIRFTDPDGNAAVDAVDGECCQHLKGFALTMIDNVAGSNLRNKYGSNSQSYRNGVSNGHGASLVLGALMATDGIGSIGGGTGGLALSTAASSTGVGAVAGGPGAAVSSGLILKGTIEVAGAAAIFKNTHDNMKSDEGTDSSNSNKGRSGKQARLRELANEPKLGKADKGWLKSDINKVAKGKRTTVRNPPGKDLAHERGREAAKGYSYKYSHLQDRSLHRRQHKYDNGGRKNKERPVEDGKKN